MTSWERIWKSRLCHCGRTNGLVVNAVDSRSGSSGLGLSPDRRHCVEFLGKTLYSHSASFHPGVQMGTAEFNAEVNPVMDLHPIQGGVEILLVASCYKNQDKLRPNCHLAPRMVTLSLPLHLTNWRQFLCVCPLIDDKLRHNIVKVPVEPRAAREWFGCKLWQCYEEIYNQ